MSPTTTTLNDNNVVTPDEAKQSIFDQLNRDGVACPSELSTQIGLPLKLVKDAIVSLMSDGIVEERPELGQVDRGSYSEMAYGISRGKFKYLSPSYWFNRDK